MSYQLLHLPAKKRGTKPELAHFEFKSDDGKSILELQIMITFCFEWLITWIFARFTADKENACFSFLYACGVWICAKCLTTRDWSYGYNWLFSPQNMGCTYKVKEPNWNRKMTDRWINWSDSNVIPLIQISFATVPPLNDQVLDIFQIRSLTFNTRRFGTFPRKGGKM